MVEPCVGSAMTINKSAPAIPAPYHRVSANQRCYTLVGTDHLTKYAQALITLSQIATATTQTLWKKYVMYSDFQIPSCQTRNKISKVSWSLNYVC